MPYSLVSAATLGFDLVRLPAGRAVAEVLLIGLAADATDLTRVAAAHPARGLEREQRGVRAVRSRRAREMAASVPHVRDAAAGDARDRAAVLVAQLEQGTIGDAPTLERLLRDDVLGSEHPAVAGLDPELRDEAAEVLADAAVGFWAAGVLPPLVRRELTSALDRVTDGGPFSAGFAVDLGDELQTFLAAVRDLDDAGRDRWRAAVDEGRAEHRPWAGAMHEASWAAHVSGRTRDLAAVQLHAVQAFLDGGFDGRDGASGAWNAVAGCVQGLYMGDLLDEVSLAVLRAPWARVTGGR
ncbi:hypothetical protein E4P39_18505 [Blastococcus sp. CT_GayMR19]|uniref:hypothetical protein n=1 Tax=Blastococcus sp. CT_GayMR19 TaxID=2559608 RepID=UPI0010739D8F|nr:hypothetical protein [Blastococcus sp. CT_GayMR19]TFV71306.1 hypothetical protein E4P39_18505 [Blastococcus sp. CT_GayMR19]